MTLTETRPLAADPDELLTEEEAAKLTKMSERTLQAWRVREVGPPYIRFGRTVRYRRRDLVAWIARNTCGRID